MLKPRPKNKALRSLLDKGSDAAGTTESSAGPTAAATTTTPEQEQQQCSNEAATADAADAASKAPQPQQQGQGQGEMAAFWKPTLSLHLVHHFDAWPHARQLPPFIVEQVR